LADHQRRLHILKEQASKWGDLHIPAHLVLDIEDTEAKVEYLRGRIADG